MLYAEEDKTPAGVATFLSDPQRMIEHTLAAMMRTPHLGEAGPPLRVIASTLDLAALADKGAVRVRTVVERLAARLQGQ